MHQLVGLCLLQGFRHYNTLTYTGLYGNTLKVLYKQTVENIPASASTAPAHLINSAEKNRRNSTVDLWYPRYILYMHQENSTQNCFYCFHIKRLFYSILLRFLLTFALHLHFYLQNIRMLQLLKPHQQYCIAFSYFSLIMIYSQLHQVLKSLLFYSILSRDAQ